MSLTTTIDGITPQYDDIIITMSPCQRIEYDHTANFTRLIALAIDQWRHEPRHVARAATRGWTSVEINSRAVATTCVYLRSQPS